MPNLDYCKLAADATAATPEGDNAVMQELSKVSFNDALKAIKSMTERKDCVQTVPAGAPYLLRMDFDNKPGAPESASPLVSVNLTREPLTWTGKNSVVFNQTLVTSADGQPVREVSGPTQPAKRADVQR
jgi:hypothetical protein